jgi:hypothetical protein
MIHPSADKVVGCITELVLSLGEKVQVRIENSFRFENRVVRT